MEVVYRAPVMKGIYRKGSKQDAPDGFFYDVRNGLILPSGVQKREGFTSPDHARWGPAQTAASFLNPTMFMYTDWSAGQRLTYAVLVKKSSTTLFALFATHAELAAPIEYTYDTTDTYNTNLIGGVEFLSNLYMRCDNSPYLYIFNIATGITVVNINAAGAGAVPNSAWDIIERKNRLYIGGNGATQLLPNEAIHYSNPGTVVFADTSVINLPAGRDLEQVRIFNWGDDMLVLTTKYPIIMRGTIASGLDAATFGEFRNEPGMTPIYPKCAVLGMLGCYYLGHNALYRFNGQYSLDLTTNVLQDIITDVFARVSKAYMWRMHPYVVLSYWADDDADSAFDTGEMHHWFYDEIEQKWAGRFTTVGYSFLAAVSNDKIGIKSGTTLPYKVRSYLYDYASNRVFYYPNDGVYTDTKQTTTANYKHTIEVPARDFGLCHKYKDLNNINIGLKVVEGADDLPTNPSGIDASISVEETPFAYLTYAAANLYTKRLQIRGSGPKEGDKDDATVTRNAFVDYPWLMPHDATYDATGKRFGVQLYQHNAYNCLTKYITMEAELSQAEQHPDKDGKRGREGRGRV